MYGFGRDGSTHVSLAVAIEIATIGITLATIAVRAVRPTAGIALAHGLSDGGARVRRVSRRDGVGLPDVHLRTA